MDPTAIARAQGVYYLVTGAWPVLSMRTFEAVTGRKRDDWLVKTVGLLALAGGGVLLRHARPAGTAGGEPLADLGIALALAFGASSAWYGGRGRIPRVYLGDALAEGAFVVAWLAASRDARYSIPTTG